MCTLFAAINQHPKYPIVLIENRDEFYKRKSDPLHKWKRLDLIAGKDHEKGGAWMGVNSIGNWGVVTNYRDLTKNIGGNRSRGALIPKIIGGKLKEREVFSFLNAHSEEFGPFNLMYSIAKKVFYFSSVEKKVKELKNGVYGLSNAFIDTPWFKINHGKKAFSSLLNEKELPINRLFELMQDETKASELELPKTGLPIEKEKLMSSLFIKSKDYGTHCTTLLIIDFNQNITIQERRIDNKFTTFNL